MIDLDAMLTPDAAAKWLGITKKTLLAKSKGRSAPIPAFRLGRMNIRYSPRMILAKLGENSGMSLPLISASLNEKP